MVKERSCWCNLLSTASILSGISQRASRLALPTRVVTLCVLSRIFILLLKRRRYCFSHDLILSQTDMADHSTESGLTPAKALLNHHQASFARRLYARPRNGDGPEEVLTRERSALATRLRASAALRRAETVEP